MLGLERAFVERVTRNKSLFLIFDPIWVNIVF